MENHTAPNRCAPILFALLCAAPLRAQEGDGGARVRARVEQRLADWRAGKLAGADQLCDALVGLGRDASPHLCRLLEEPSSDFPVGPVARAVARLGSPQCLPALGHLTASPLAANRAAAIEALGILGREEALPSLAGALDDEDPDVSEKAESALLAQRLPTAHVARALSLRIEAGKDKDRAARVLGRLGGGEAHVILLGHLDSSDERQSLAALQGLRILSLQEDGPEVLLLMRTTPSAEIRKEACLYFGGVKYGPAVRDLIELLREETPGLAANAHWALKQITGLGLKQDAELWGFWWDRSGKKLYGPHPDPRSRQPKG